MSGTMSLLPHKKCPYYRNKDIVPTIEFCVYNFLIIRFDVDGFDTYFDDEYTQLVNGFGPFGI